MRTNSPGCVVTPPQLLLPWLTQAFTLIFQINNMFIVLGTNRATDRIQHIKALHVQPFNNKDRVQQGGFGSVLVLQRHPL